MSAGGVHIYIQYIYFFCWLCSVSWFLWQWTRRGSLHHISGFPVSPVGHGLPAVVLHLTVPQKCPGNSQLLPQIFIHLQKQGTERWLYTVLPVIIVISTSSDRSAFNQGCTPPQGIAGMQNTTDFWVVIIYRGSFSTAESGKWPV